MSVSVLHRLERALSFCESTFIGAALAVASLILFVNVILRYVFLSGLPWAEEVTMYLIVWVVFVGGSVIIRTFGHIRIDLLPLALSPPNVRRLRIFVSLLMIAFFAVFIYYSGLHTLRVMKIGQLTPVLEAPMWLTYLAMPVGCLLMGIRTGQVLYRTVVSGVGDGAHFDASAD